MPAARLHPSLRGLTWVSPWLLGFGLFMLLPIALSAWYSLTDYSLLDRPIYVGLENYRELLHDSVAHAALKNSAIFTFATVGIGTLLSLALALLLEQKLPGSEFVRAIVFLPTLVPVIAAALLWMWALNTETGSVNTLLRTLHLPTPDWLGTPTGAMASIVLVSLWGIGTFVVTYAAAIRGVPQSLYEAACIDGAGPIRRLTTITLPIISPTLAFNIVMSIIWSLQAFAVPLVMTRGGPANATTTFALYVYQNAFVFGRMGYACALAWVQFLFTLVLVTGVLWASRRAVYHRGA